MKISENSIRCSYDECQIISASLLLEKNNEEFNEQKLNRLSTYITESHRATKKLAKAQIKYIKDDEPTSEEVISRLRQLGSLFMSIPRDEEIDVLIPTSLSNFIWCFADRTETLTDTQLVMLELASQMSVELMVSIDCKLD